MGYFGLMLKSEPFFTNNLIAWYLHHKRDLPWRNTRDPYRVWLSEIILQQTRVAQGLPYYLKFVEAYPTVKDLADAPEDDVLKNWQGLGYYTRARNLHKTAQIISNELHGEFPTTYKDLIKLKGVGDYTASAVASICFNKPEAVVDGNVYRVLARIFGITTPINTPAGHREFKTLARLLLDPSQPGIFNQAVMEFGARYCLPQNPDCDPCIFRTHCMAYQKNTVGSLPVKIRPKPVTNRYFNYLVVISDNEKTLLQQRIKKGIWHKLYEFPLIETDEEIELDQLQKMLEYQSFTKNLDLHSPVLYNEKPIVHKLSHQHLHTRFWIVGTTSARDNFIDISAIENYAVPVLIGNFVSEFFEEYGQTPDEKWNPTG